MGDPNLVTTCNFHGQEFLFKMNIVNNNLEILITDKNSGEEWQCSYDATYIENLTHKTGNFKQFDIFVAMIKSGLLRTSESVSLDLLTYDDLEMLRSRKITKSAGSSNNNRRYLIITYVVEFDKIRYPLPLEYCGPPDPVILQGTIRRLELELSKTREELSLKSHNNDTKKIYYLQKRIDELTEENEQLREENHRLTKMLDKKPKAQMCALQKAVNNLEKSVVSERHSHHELVEKLRLDKAQLAKELEKLKCSEKSLRNKLSRMSQNPSRMDVGDFKQKIISNKKISSGNIKTVYKRSKSPVGDYVPSRKNRSKSKDFSKKSEEMASCKYDCYRSSRSRGSSTSSTKYADTEPNEFDPFVRKSPICSQSCSRSQSPLLKSRGSSECSRNSSRGRPRSKNKERNIDVEALKQQLDTLQKMISNSI